MSATTEPLARRDEIVEQLAEIGTRQADAQNHHRTLSDAAVEAEQCLVAVRIAEASGSATPAEVANAREIRDATRRAVNDPELTEAHEARQRAVRQLTRELSNLTRQHHAAFEAEAAALSAKAEEALAKVRAAVREAEKPWSEARSAWARLQRQQDGGGHTASPTPDELRFGAVPPFPIQIAAHGEARPAEAALNPWA